MPEEDENNTHSSENDDEIENVRVVVRVRPMDKSELESGCENCVKVDKINRCITVIKPNAPATEPPKNYYFDSVYAEDSTQIDLYVDTARPIVDKVLEGYNGTILAYGQTGTGKTYTMSGHSATAQTKGVIPNTFAHIFGHIAKAKDNQKFLVRVSYMEIYNEEVRDLLAKEMKKSLEVKERADIGVYVKDLSGYVVNNADDLDNIMKLGNKNRATGATKMNMESSRSHAIFSITVESSETDDKGAEHVKMGKLQLVDLAGSERQSKTQATGIRLKEATKINLSLSVLGNVISALVDGKSTHIPYRNSKLTRLLQDSLGGNSKTVMCASISPADSNYVETISTLRYASRAKSIQNHTHINDEPKDALLRHFQEEIAELKKQLEEGAIENTFDETDEDANDDDEANIDSNAENNKEELQNKMEKKKKRRSKAKTDAAESEKELLAAKVLERESELKRTKTEQETLLTKLQTLENKILVGGENLLEKADAQEKLLESSIAQLEEVAKIELELKESLQKKEAERIDIEERYSSLQEECIGKTKKLHRVMQMLMGVKSELADQQQEQQREKEGILESIRILSRELALCEFVLNSYVPREYINMIEGFTQWNEDVGDWQLKCVAYTGNNMRKNMQDERRHTKETEFVDLSHIYLSYSTGSVIEPMRARGQSATRPRTSGSGVPRPLTRPYKIKS
ncbi:kinesin-like protein KIF3A [Contarinia nasturtii]|uniref:kinesin-like protein KIF3A n=1 Tax=Contarinia nasturtii TaxID=265458 RepID=UPI0012D46BE7|nr:kinesin-like protein KIF3A [Contarinia nasturtii]